MRHSEYNANLTLAQSARIASRPVYKSQPRKVTTRERIAAACAPGGSVGPWLRFAGYAVVVFLAAHYGSAQP